MKLLDLSLPTKIIHIKDKKSGYKVVESLSKNEYEQIFDKYVVAKSYKYIKNLFQLIFNFFSTDSNIDRCGKCIICGQDTDFNILTKKYARLDKEECKNKYIEQFKERMNRVHGRSYYTQDPEAQKRMLNNRELTTEYKFGKFTYNVVGNYEADFLDFMLKIMRCDPSDIIECPFHIDYEVDGMKKFYIPDFYIPSLNLVVEIKSSKSAYADRDRKIEDAKRLAGIEYMKRNHGYYFYLIDKNYVEFIEYLRKIIDKNEAH